MGQQEPEKQPTLIWDVMSTLVYDPFFVEVPEFFGMPLKQLYKEKDPDAWTDFEKGLCSEEDLFKRFFRDGREFDGEGLLQKVNDRYEWLPGMEELMTELCAEGRNMHILSNYPVWWNNIEGKLQLSRFAKWSFVSCDMGLRKPDPAIFKSVQASLALDSAQCLLVDDSAANVDGARAQGWDAILFTDAQDCREQLRQRGFLCGPIQTE